MTATNKQTGATKKRSRAQIKADERYTEKNRENNRENQKKNYKNISATIKREKAEDIAATFKAHGVTVAEVVSAAAERLKVDGQTTAQTIKANAAAFNTRHEGIEHAAQSATTAAEQPAAPADSAPADSPKE